MAERVCSFCGNRWCLCCHHGCVEYGGHEVVRKTDRELLEEIHAAVTREASE